MHLEKGVNEIHNSKDRISLLWDEKYSLPESSPYKDNIIFRWLNYKINDTFYDLDTTCENHFKSIYSTEILNSCQRRDTMTSPLASFSEYITFVHPWKRRRAQGTNSLLSVVEKEYDNFGNDFLYKEIQEFIEYTTSVWNFIPVPEFFNKGRSGPLAKWDFWDLTLTQIYKWFSAKEANDTEKMKDSLRLLFAHSVHKKLIYDFSTDLYKSMKEAEKWLSKFETWDDFIKTFYLQSFLDEKKKPILFWEGHSFELPLPTDVVCNDDKTRKEKIHSNFQKLFINCTSCLKGREIEINNYLEGQDNA